MLTLTEINLDTPQQLALRELDNRLQKEFKIDELILFGSVARGEANEESDIDVLVISKERISRKQRHKISDVALEVNLKYDTNISTVVVDFTDWETGPISVLPFHYNVVREGVKIE